MTDPSTSREPTHDELLHRLRVTEERARRLEAELASVRGLHRLLREEREPRALVDRAARWLLQTRGIVACGIAVDGVVEATAGDAASLEGASARIPLVSEGRCLGELCAALPEDADGAADELGILAEMADDLSAALVSVEREARLRESEARYRLVAENVSDVIWVLDLDAWRVVYTSPSVEKMRGFTAEEVVEQEFDEVMSPGSMAHVMGVLPGRLAKYAAGVVGPYLDPIEHSCKDGSTVWTECTTRFGRDEATGHVLIYGSTRYVGDRRQAEQALRETEERYRTLVENLDDVVISSDMHGTITFASEAVARFGWKPEEVVGRPIGSFVHPDDLATLLAERADVARWTSEPMEYRIVDAAGKARFVRSTLRPIFQHDQLVGCSGVVIDLTRQREMEEQLRAAQKMEAVGRLAGGVAHDFNNLLSVIGSYTDFALDQLHEGDPLHADLTEVRKASTRAEALTRQLLAFSRKQILKLEAVDLNALVAGTTSMLKRLIGEDIDLVVAPADDLGLTRGDPGQIEQVLMNLAVNARDAMVNGGTLTITTANGEPSSDGQSDVVVRVSDTGAGMDRATLARIFEPFFTTKGLGKGTGLGLSTVYGIIQQSGGRIDVESELGHGTTFTISLPRAGGPASHAPPPPSVHRPAAGGETVMLVEDEEAVRNLTRRILLAAGYSVLVASNGGEALLLCERQSAPPSLMLTDVVMPVMSGPALAARLAPLYPTMRVVYMSGYTDDAIAHRGVLEPGIELIGKPFRAEDLIRTVRRVLDAG